MHLARAFELAPAVTRGIYPMLIFLVGLPNQFTQWCEALIAKLVERTSESLLCSSAGSSEELLQAIIQHPSQHIFVSQRQPGNWLYRILAAANGQCVVALTDSRSCVAELVVGPNDNLVETVCSVANSCATLTSYLSLPGVLILRAEEHSLDPVVTARRIAVHLQLPSADEDIKAVLDTVSPLDHSAVRTAGWEHHIDASKIAMINGALAGYAEHFTGAPLGNLIWAPNLFIVGNSHQRLTGPIDITGRSRCLIYGPYIRLPSGRWNADVAVAFTDLGGSKDFIIDVVTTIQLNSISINVVNQGGVQTSLPFALDPANESAVEVRVSNIQAAFEGRLALGAVTLRPQHGAPKELLELFTTASDA
jgi:hypothetical protein